MNPEYNKDDFSPIFDPKNRRGRNQQGGSAAAPDLASQKSNSTKRFSSPWKIILVLIGILLVIFYCLGGGCSSSTSHATISHQTSKSAVIHPGETFRFPTGGKKVIYQAKLVNGAGPTGFTARLTDGAGTVVKEWTHNPGDYFDPFEDYHFLYSEELEIEIAPGYQGPLLCSAKITR